MRRNPFALAVLLLWVAGPASAVTIQSWVATARIMSGNTTLTDSPDPAAPSGPDDTTGFLEANGANIFSPPPTPPIDAGAQATFGISSGILAGTAGFGASSNAPADNRIFTVFAGASVTYIDELTVESATLGFGTPVDVRFVFDLAFSADAISSASTSTMKAIAAADLSSVANGVTGIDQNTNRFFEDTETATFIQNGIFTGAQHLEYQISTTVGSTFQFSLVVDVDASGGVAPASGVNSSATGWSSMAVAFGGEVLEPASAAGLSSIATSSGTYLSSAILQNEFPLAGLVSPGAAAGALPENPFELPEPSTLALLAFAVLMFRRVGSDRG